MYTTDTRFYPPPLGEDRLEKKEHPNRTSFFLVLRCFVCCVDSRDVHMDFFQ